MKNLFVITFILCFTICNAQRLKRWHHHNNDSVKITAYPNANSIYVVYDGSSVSPITVGSYVITPFSGHIESPELMAVRMHLQVVKIFAGIIDRYLKYLKKQA